MENARDQIQDIFSKLIAIQDDLARAMMTSISLSETANSNRPAEPSGA